MSEFLERVQKSSALGDHDRTLDAVRGVFFALFLGVADGQERAAAEHLPDELEILWKPALFACLREEDEAGAGERPDAEAFVARVRRHAPALEGERVEPVARAVLRELRPRLSADGRSRLAAGLPDHLRDGWNG